MADELNDRINQLMRDLLDGSEEVDRALEAADDQRQLAAGRHIEGLVRRYDELLEGLEGEQRDRVERSLGRRLTDLRRSAASLTRRLSGTSVKRASDAGHVPFLEHRAPPKSIVPSRAAPARNAPRYSVGGEVESWCGKCGEFRTHHIVAMVGDLPKQVICNSCRSRHGYRTEPSTRGNHAVVEKPAVQEAAFSRTPSTAEEREAARRRELKKVLIKELDDAVDPRRFSPKERYKAGEIIFHPEHGRGKIENVLKGSLLVRFREGLRPLNLG